MAFSWSSLSTFPVRRVGRLLAVLAIAIAAGHLVQTLAARQGRPQVAAASLPTKIVQLSASPDDNGVTTAPALDLSKPLPQNHIISLVPLAPPAEGTEARDCRPALKAAEGAGAVVTLTLRAPCDGGARVVLSHAGLTVTGRLAADGGLSVTIPALDQAGRFEIRFADGRTVEAVQPVPELATMRRFAVQWLGPDGFILHGFENGADFGQPGDVSPQQPGSVPTGAARGGWLGELGDRSVDNPLLAQVYTFPLQGTADVVVEAPVTAGNCAQDMLGQTVSSVEGVAQVVDLTLAMPDCSAVGDFLVLKNLAQDTKVATK